MARLVLHFGQAIPHPTRRFVRHKLPIWGAGTLARAPPLLTKYSFQARHQLYVIIEHLKLSSHKSSYRFEQRLWQTTIFISIAYNTRTGNTSACASRTFCFCEGLTTR